MFHRARCRAVAKDELERVGPIAHLRKPRLVDLFGSFIQSVGDDGGEHDEASLLCGDDVAVQALAAGSVLAILVHGIRVAKLHRLWPPKGPLAVPRSAAQRVWLRLFDFRRDHHLAFLFTKSDFLKHHLERFDIDLIGVLANDKHSVREYARAVRLEDSTERAVPHIKGRQMRQKVIAHQGEEQNEVVDRVLDFSWRQIWRCAGNVTDHLRTERVDI
mmetsp:Transcript_12633/g.35671  ORF Transcript_12633/g.35671 Transcript_12633/m.35671 type:complete len:217 (+) Transcript_12633:1720-2370(+)